MKPQPMVVPFWSPEEVEAAINGTLAHLAAGKVLAYPTETVYGFGGAVDERSVQQLVSLKGRAPGKPFLLLVARSEMITRLGLHLTGYASMLAATGIISTIAGDGTPKATKTGAKASGQPLRGGDEQV